MRKLYILLLFIVAWLGSFPACKTGDIKTGREVRTSKKFAKNDPDTTRVNPALRAYGPYVDSLTEVMVKEIYRTLEWIRMNGNIARQAKEKALELLSVLHPKNPVDLMARDLGKVNGHGYESRDILRMVYPNFIRAGESGSRCNPHITIDADFIMRGIHFQNNGHGKGRVSAFGNSLGMAMMATFESLEGGLPNPPSFFREKVQNRYREIQEPLSRVLFDVASSYHASKNNPSYPDFSHYRSVEAFLFAYNASIGSVIDAVYTEVYADWGLVSTGGLKVFGSAFRCVLEGIAAELASQLYSEAMARDLEQNKRNLEENIRRYFKGHVVEQRGDTLRVSETIEKSQNFQVDVELEIMTYLNMGLDIGQLYVEFDHSGRKVTIIIPPKPRMIEKVMQDYVVRNANVHIYDCEGILNWATQSGMKTIEEFRIESAFRKHRVPVKQMDIYNNPFELDILKAAIKDDLQKVLEPFCVMLRHSGYEADMELNGETEPLIEHLNNNKSSENNPSPRTTK